MEYYVKRFLLLRDGKVDGLGLRRGPRDIHQLLDQTVIKAQGRTHSQIHLLFMALLYVLL